MRKLTKKPAAAGNAARLEPEFVRVNDVARLFGIKRGSIYNLIADGKIKSISLRIRGQKHGLRLIHMASVRALVEAELAAQTRGAA